MQFHIKEIRLQKGIRQEDLAKKAGVSRTVISGLESGRVRVTSTETLEKVADAMGVSVREIIG